jgi:hypothetical protein
MQPGALPDPGVIFDSIMARKPENREQHPNKISSVLFYLASIISKYKSLLTFQFTRMASAKLVKKISLVLGGDFIYHLPSPARTDSFQSTTFFERIINSLLFPRLPRI